MSNHREATDRTMTAKPTDARVIGTPEPKTAPGSLKPLPTESWRSDMENAPRDGWKVAPVEPTQEQVLAGWEEQNHWCLVNGDSEEVRAIYRAMLAASPTQPVVWQPIETAPKDGTAVHLGFWYQGRFAQYIGFNDGRGWMENSRTFFPSHMRDWFTHWQLPPASPLPTDGEKDLGTTGDIT